MLSGPPANGYFYIQQPPVLQQAQPPVQLGTLTEGIDGYGNPSVRMNNATPTSTPVQLPALCFTVQRLTSGNQPQDYFTARIPGQIDYPSLPSFMGPELQLFNLPPLDYQPPVPIPTQPANPPQPPALRNLQNPNAPGLNASGLLLNRWAEIGYFLVPTGNKAGTNNQMPLFSLRRRVRVLLDPGASQQAQQLSTLLNTPSNLPPNQTPQLLNTNNLWNTRYSEVSCQPDANGFLHFNTPADLATTANQFLPQQWLAQIQGPQNSQGQFPWVGDDLVLTDVISFNIRALPLGGTDYVDLGQAIPATGIYTTAAFPFAIAALEITIRVWDVKTSLTRQVTIIQDI